MSPAIRVKDREITIVTKNLRNEASADTTYSSLKEAIKANTGKIVLNMGNPGDSSSRMLRGVKMIKKMIEENGKTDANAAKQIKCRIEVVHHQNPIVGRFYTNVILNDNIKSENIKVK